MSVSQAENPIALGQAISKARQAANLTQQQLCAKTGIAYSTLTKIERGAIKKPNVFTVLKIAQQTNLKLESILQDYNISYFDDFKIPTLDEESQSQSSSSVKFIYFDIHETLINSSYGMLAALACQASVPLNQLDHFYNKNSDDICKGVISAQKMQELLDNETQNDTLLWADFYLKAVVPNMEIQQACQWLIDRKYRVGLLTNAFPGNVSALMNHKIIPHGYKVIVDSSQVNLMKPDIEIFKYAQKAAGVLAEEILLVDDRSINLMMAQVCGWQTLGVNEFTKGRFLSLLQGFLN